MKGCQTSCAIAHTAVLPALLARCWPQFFCKHPAFALTLQDILAYDRPELVLPPPPPPTLWHRRNGGIVSESGGKGLKLPLHWESLPSAASSELVVFVHCSWLRTRLQQRPCPQEVLLLGGRGGVESLLSFHEHMLALACAVIDHAALVCLVQDEGSFKGELAEGELGRHATVLELHGLSIAATVPEEEIMSWARAQGSSAFAVVCADARIPYMSAAVGGTPGRSKVDARSTAACGAALFVSNGECCGVDDELLAIPLAACVRPCDADMSLVALPPPLAALSEEPGNWAALCVRVALVQAVQRGADDARAQYWTRVCPPSHFAASHMACWAQDSPAALHAQHSISYRRACAWREGVERQRRALASAGLAVSSELFLWAALVVQSRAVLVDGMGPVLCPGVDCANHVSVLPSARVLVEGDLVRLLATGRLEGGMEVTLCYDAEADYLDVFERWGFFDTSSTVHTAEVVVPAAALTPGAGDRGHEDQDWRRQLVEAQAEIGCNATFDSWWVPDVALEVCPLLCAVRALFVAEEELLALDEEVCIDDVLTSEIAREDEVRRMLATLFREHLAGYGEEGEDHGGGRQGAGCGQEMEAALKLVSFEKRLLRDQLEVLLRSVAVAA